MCDISKKVQYLDITLCVCVIKCVCVCVYVCVCGGGGGWVGGICTHADA